MKKDKISIIVPIYNSELYIDECIKSLINQTYNNIEIILVNDGSIDKSFDICEEYQKTDNRIKLRDNQKNMGVSFSRNKGLDIATGNYVMFLDSDDYFDNDYIEKMYNSIIKNKCEMGVSGFRCFSDKKEEIVQYLNHDKVLTFDMIAKDFVSTHYFNSVSKTIIDLDIIKKNNIKFDTSLAFFEDQKFSFMVMNKCSRIMYLSNCYYNYRTNDNSSTRNMSFNKVYKWFEDNNFVIDYMISNTNKLDINYNNIRLSKLKATLCILAKMKNQTYKKFKFDSKKIIDKFYDLVDIDTINLKEMNYENSLNKFRIKLILKNHLRLFYYSVLLSEKIKR